MDVPDFLLKAAGVVGTLGMVYLAFVKHRADSRTSDIISDQTLMDNYNKLVDRLTAQDERMSVMRSQLNQQADINAANERTVRTQTEEIAQLNRAAVRHSNDIERATRDAAEYKARWEATNLGLGECMASCQQQAAEIRALRAYLIKLGGLTPDVEAAIQAELDAPPEAPETSKGDAT